MLDNETKEKIDNMSYRDMLELWRFAPVGHSYFSEPDISDYFSKVMAEKKKTANHVQTSKNIGWCPKW